MSLPSESIQQLFSSNYFRQEFEEADCTDAIAALPDASLNFLLEICSRAGVKTVFEFGSGRSTKAFLQAGLSVTSLEDSAYWMQKSLEDCSPNLLARHRAFVIPLRHRMLGLFPVMDWDVQGEIGDILSSADLVLVDSPYFTPFRESTLWTSFQRSPQALIILDDTRIPTLMRFCKRLAFANPDLLYKQVNVGHGFGLFSCCNCRRLKLGQSLKDVLSGWRRYFMGRRFYESLRQAKRSSMLSSGK